MPVPTRQSWKMNCRGVNLSMPIDQLPPGDYPYLMNSRVVDQGSIESRPGQLAASTVAGNVHSVRRLNNISDPINPYELIVGVDNGLYAGHDSLSLIDSGYSGDPLSMVRFRPEESPEAWMYIADKNKMRKVGTSLIVRNVGIDPPKHEPYADTTYPDARTQRLMLGPFDNRFWVPVGPVSDPEVVDRIPLGDDPRIIHFIYDGVISNNGFVNCQSNVNGFEWKQPGSIITVDPGGPTEEVVAIQESHNDISPTFISNISYDVGNTGLCTMVLGTQAVGLTRNSLLRLNNGEIVRVLSTTVGPDGLSSIRAWTEITHIPGESVDFGNSFRIALSNVHPPEVLPGVPITAKAIEFTVTPSGSESVTGRIWRSQVIDCSVLGNRPIQPDDYIHISLKFDNPANLLYGRLLLNIDPDHKDDAAFETNYYFKEFRPSDFQAAVSGSTSIESTQTAIQNAYIEGAGIPYIAGDIYTAPSLLPNTNLTETDAPQSQQLGTGDNVWNELLFRVSDLQRVGSNINLGLKDVNTIGIEVVVQNGPLTVTANSWTFGGTFGPDVPEGNPVGIKYRYRYRDSTTGDKSIPGPAIRYEVFPSRQEIALKAQASTDPQVDSIDFERLDPNLQAADQPPVWKYVGTQPNNQGGIGDDWLHNGLPWIDTVTPVYLGGMEALDTTAIKPFPTLGPPLSGTVTTVGTTVVLVSGDPFPTNLLQNTVIRINGVAYQTFATPTAGDRLELVNSAGVQNSVPYQIDSPTLFGTPLPFVFGPLEGPTASFLFGLGDLNNPGTLYWTNGNDPDGASDKNFVEVTSPSEPLVAGAVWGTTIIVGSRDRLFMGQPTFGQENPFTFTEIPAGSGIWARWAISPGLDGVYYLGRDGIYRATPYYGGQNVSKDLWPLFPHEGVPGVPTNGYFPVNMSLLNKLRVSVADSDIYFDYTDTTGIQRTMRSAPTTTGGAYTPAQVSGWFPYTYANPVNTHYWEEVPQGVQPRLLEACSNGELAYAGGNIDITAPIVCDVTLPSLNSEDSRIQKLYVDAMTDLVGMAQLTVMFDYAQSSQAPAAVTSPVGRTQQRTTIDTNTNLALRLNISAHYTFGPGTVLYEFQPSFYPQPYLSNSMVTQFTSHGISGWKHQRFARICVITSSPATLQIKDDLGRTFTYTIPAGVNPINLYQTDLNMNFNQKARLFEYSLTSPTPFALFPDETVIRIKKWGGDQFVDVPIFKV